MSSAYASAADTAECLKQADPIGAFTVMKIGGAEDSEHGPRNYHLDDAAEVTVVIANDNQVVATHTFKAASVDVAKVMGDVEQMLNWFL